ncbi:hypothetical protein [Sphingobacterium sp. 1.A.4]|uniref:hypothetical protein n=1 Tax=Sphingobacterium sp. 1.A.4 TaxID=2044603 RepID=UPI000C0BE324|nr:hypothetical protein [Sphingobacterium sp. 1.A.4]
MRTNVDVIQAVARILHKSNVKNIISGVIQPRRPINSTKEDVTINSLFVTLDQLQKGLINVNVNIPNISVRQNGLVDSEVPDLKRLNIVTKEVINVVEGYAGEDIYLDIEQTILIEEKGSSCMNIRVAVRAKNL